MGKFADFLKAAGEVLNTITGHKKKLFTSAIIVAGGSSLRMGGEITKQMMLVNSLPVVVHTLLAFERTEEISEIIVVAKEDEVPLYDGFAKKYGITKLKNVVVGGSTRQESALKGFDATSPKADFVAIHDAARCLVKSEDILRVLENAVKYGAASACTSVFDTVKIVNKNGFIVRTEDRNTVKLAQTPQIFKRNLYCAAAYTAREEGFEATDDNMLIERINFPVKLVECSSDNIKITHPHDIERAEVILNKRKGEA